MESKNKKFKTSDYYKKTIEPTEIINKLQGNSKTRKFLKTCNKIEKLNSLEPLNRITEIFNRIEKDKKAVKGNSWHNIILNELEAKEYEINQLKKELNEKKELLNKINKLTNNNDTKKPPINKQLANIDVQDTLHYFKTSLLPIIKTLFTDTNSYKWEQILKGETIHEPIRLQPKTTLKQVFLFFDELRTNGLIVKNFQSILTKTKGIYHNNKPITLSQLKNARDEVGKNLSEKDSKVLTFFEDFKKFLE